jgi:hypothetical protein
VKSVDSIWRKLLLWGVLSAGLAALLEVLRLAVGVSFSWEGLATRWMFIAGLLLAIRWAQPYPIGGTLDLWPWPGVLGAVAGAGAVLAYATRGATWAAWVVLGALYLLLLELDAALVGRQGVVCRWGTRGLLALAGGIAPVCIAQIESHFADEEFFVALQAMALCFFCFMLLAARDLLAWPEPKSARRGPHLDRRTLSILLILFALAGACVTVHAYQRSFYPPEAPTYEGISAEAPFLCGKALPDLQAFDSAEIFRQLLTQIEPNPHKGSLEYGMLALGTGDQHWAQAFRESLLSEAAEGRFTGPAYSIKSVQYEAALRAYYLPRVHSAFPFLFSHDDLVLLREWFADINRRALTVEWVDWTYALAFAKWPEGPYENQENGAGLLALLESAELAAPELSSANQDYLRRNQRGWLTRFRNTDDAFIYQLAWINNAYFQSFYAGAVPENNVRLSFEWLLLQALPDGAPLRYNHPAHFSLASFAYLGARLLEDSRFVWLAGRALEAAQEQGQYPFAQPGAEQFISLSGHSPTQGSCLLYGDSGLPNQVGPLAPDKLVLRDGWSKDAAYLLLNLRFTGWHRYKATNTVTLLYQSGTLAADMLDGERFTWLPAGRSVFRDKRIPRENLNGLLVERDGMSAVLHTLAGIGSPWAQDPPHYAEVVAFETGEARDWAHTRLTNWRGWQHDRWIYLYHNDGPIIVVDEAKGPSRSQAALAWHLTGEGIIEDQRIRLRGGDEPAEVLLLPLGPRGQIETAEDVDSSLRVVYHAPADGRVHVVTLFLLGQWTGAEVGFNEEEGILRIAKGPTRDTISLRLGE